MTDVCIPNEALPSNRRFRLARSAEGVCIVIESGGETVYFPLSTGQVAALVAWLVGGGE